MNDTRFKCSFIKKDGTEKEVEFKCNTFEIRTAKEQLDNILLFEYVKNIKDASELDKLWNAVDIGDSDLHINMFIDDEEFEIFSLLQITDTNLDFAPSTTPMYVAGSYPFMKTLRMC